MTSYDKLFIGGRWTEPAGSETIEVRSPHDQSLVGRVPGAAEADVDRAVEAARQAFDHGPWPRTTPSERRAVLARFNELHTARGRELAALVTSENGTPLWFTGLLHNGGIAEQTASYLRASESFGWEERLESGTTVRREPVGVIAAVIPWNAPHQSALAKIVPALLAGCTVVLKAAPETALDALVLGEIFAEAGLPEGVLSILPAGREVSEYLVSHPSVDKIAFTGSTAAGRRIAAIAGEQLKRVSLELGGKSAAIILEDADLAAVAEGLKTASLANNGESCVAHTRILAPRSRYEEIVAALATMIEGLTVGDPSDPATFIGPMVRADQQQRVRNYIDLGIKEGARLVVGGSDVPQGLEGGFYVRPTLFADVDNSMRIARRRSSVPFSSSSRSTTRRTPCGSPTTPRTASAAACGAPTPSTAWRSPAVSVPERFPSTGPTPRSTGRSAATRPAGSAVNSGLSDSASTSSSRRSAADVPERNSRATGRT